MTAKSLTRNNYGKNWYITRGLLSQEITKKGNNSWSLLMVSGK